MSTAGSAPTRPPRSGRNVPMAIGVGLGLGAIIVASLLTYRQTFIAVVAAAVVVSVVEMRATLHRAGIALQAIPVALASAGIIIGTWWFGFVAQGVGLAVGALLVFVWRFTGGADGYLRDVSASLFLLVYIGLFASFATLLLVPPDGTARVLTFLIAVVCSDTGGFAAGVLLGKHPMAPRISPKKSWEGMAGSLVLAALAGSLCFVFMLDQTWWKGAIFGAVLAVVATVGDLSESLIKRDLGVKDMGTVLPGHGGVMDRLDSMLPGAVVSFLLMWAMI